MLHRLHEDVLAKYDAFTVGETVFVTPKMADDLVNPTREELSTVFAFEHMETDCYKIKWFLRRFNPDCFFACLTKWQKALPWNTVYLETTISPARFLASVMIPNIMMKAPRHLPRSFLP